MTTHLFATGSRARRISIAAASLLAALLLIASPRPAHAADGKPNTTVLAQGIGMRDEPSTRVRTVQRALDRRGYDLGAPGVDGRFGPLTDSAVRRFQARRGLAVDGVVGTRTRTALRITDLTPATGSRQSRTPTTKATKPAPPKAQPQPQATGPAQPQPKATAPAQPQATAPPSTAPAQPQSTAPQSTTPSAGPARTTAQPATGTAPARPAESTVDTGPDVSWLVPLLIGVAVSLVITGLATLALRGARRWAAPHDAPDPNGAYADSRMNRARPHMRPALTLVEPVAHTPAIAVREAGVRDIAPVDGDRVLGYIRTWDDDHHGETEQEHAIEQGCADAGWDLVDIVRDDGDHDHGRHSELVTALARVARGEARALVTSDAESVIRANGDLETLRSWLGDPSAALVLHEPGPAGAGTAAPALVAITLDARPLTERRDVG
jgi:peptidoglycan hydrolase-like protein with peptidoglycan-binding domain